MSMQLKNIPWFKPWAHVLRRGMCSPPRASGPPAAETPQQSSGPATSRISPQYHPSEFHKFILVWTKKYKSKADIPKFVTPDLIERAQSEARIKIANILMLLTILASLWAVFSGKAAAKRGESVLQMNQDWHKKYNEEYEKKHNLQDTK